MMKRMLACLATSLFLVGLVGIAQAAGRDFCTEGPDYRRDYKERQIVQTKLRCTQGRSLYIEGMGTGSCAKGIKTIVPIASNPSDFYSEGFSHTELEYMKIIKIHDEIAPAAGNKLQFMKSTQLNALIFLELE